MKEQKLISSISNIFLDTSSKYSEELSLQERFPKPALADVWQKLLKLEYESIYIDPLCPTNVTYNVDNPFPSKYIPSPDGYFNLDYKGRAINYDISCLCFRYLYHHLIIQIARQKNLDVKEYRILHTILKYEKSLLDLGNDEYRKLYRMFISSYWHYIQINDTLNPMCYYVVSAINEMVEKIQNVFINTCNINRSYYQHSNGESIKKYININSKLILYDIDWFFYLNDAPKILYDLIDSYNLPYHIETIKGNHIFFDRKKYVLNADNIHGFGNIEDK